MVSGIETRPCTNMPRQGIEPMTMATARGDTRVGAMAVPEARIYADVNAVVAGYLRDLAFAQSSQQKMFGYKRAAAAILSLDKPLTELLEPDGALQRIPGKRRDRHGRPHRLWLRHTQRLRRITSSRPSSFFCCSFGRVSAGRLSRLEMAAAGRIPDRLVEKVHHHSGLHC